MNASSKTCDDAHVLLDVDDVQYEYTIRSAPFRSASGFKAVSGVSLTIRRGDVLGLVGESGCGKSTLAKIVLGLLPASSGSVRLAGSNIGTLDGMSRARLVQPVFQDPYGSLNPSRSIGASIGLPLSVHRLCSSMHECRARVCEMLERVGLPAEFYERFPGQLSGGQRQRAAIARAVIMRPQLVVCDEPTSALDVSVQSHILNLLEELRQGFGLTYLFISHNLAVVEHFATKVAVMYRGQIVEQASAETLFSGPAHPYTRALLASALSIEPGETLPDIPESFAAGSEKRQP